MTISLSNRDARRIALHRLGLGGRRPKRPGPAAVAAMFGRLGMVQIDSVSVLARAHTMPAFSRLGPYDVGLLDRAAFGRRRTLFEYWGHEAALIRTDLFPALRWRMEEARAGRGIYGGLARFAGERRAFIDEVLAAVVRRGPLAARDIEGGEAGAGGWWGWSDAKRALEWLFWAGFVTTRTRRGFERVYDLTERVLPEAAALPAPSHADGQRALIRTAAVALGVATVADLRLYWRIGPEDGARRVAELVEAGELLPATVEGWRQPAFLHRDAGPLPRPKAQALVSPFDPLLWERDRAERLFGLRYRIEIYVPAEKREHGYYVLPFLHGDRIAARLDLKADRQRSVLLVKAAHCEAGCDSHRTAEALAAELGLLRDWLGLGAIAVEPKGDLAPALAALAPR